MKNLKKIIFTTCISSLAFLVFSVSVFAYWSPNYVLLCPKFGAWSNPSPREKKTDNNNASYKVMMAPHAMPIYGDLISNETGERSIKDYYRVWSGYTTHMQYKSGYGTYGTYYQARISSSDFEPDTRNTTITFKP